MSVEIKAATLDEIRFQDHTREEVILWLRANAAKNPSYERLARWISESSEFDRCNYNVRVAVAQAERAVEGKLKDWSSEFGPGQKACGSRSCGVSTAIDGETLTFGRGKLDNQGFWSVPCRPCAKQYEKAHPEYRGRVWPASERKECNA